MSQTSRVRITGSFEGGNPRDPESILSVGENSFVVYPYSEDEDPVYKFRLDVKAVSESSQPVKLRIDWKDARFNEYRTRLFAKAAPSGWRSCEGNIAGESVDFELELSPGETHLTLNPTYDYQDYLEFVLRAGESSEVAGRRLIETDEGRQVWLLATPEGKTKKRILITARAHPYETAGSYCIEGILGQVLRGRADFLEGFQLFVLPMLCPDGVANGLCKLSGADGEDMARSENGSDRLVSSVMSLIDEIRPHFFLDLHNWMIPDRNGLFYERPSWMRRFARSIDKSGCGNRAWTFGTRRRFFARRPQGVKAYAKDRYGTRCMTVEYPWFGRSIEDMKRLGVETITTLETMLIG